jgi:hypothetical protein
MSEPKPKIKTVKQLEKELPSPEAPVAPQKEIQRILKKIRERQQEKLT